MERLWTYCPHCDYGRGAFWEGQPGCLYAYIETSIHHKVQIATNNVENNRNICNMQNIRFELAHLFCMQEILRIEQKHLCGDGIKIEILHQGEEVSPPIVKSTLLGGESLILPDCMSREIEAAFGDERNHGQMLEGFHVGHTNGLSDGTLLGTTDGLSDGCNDGLIEF